MVFESRNINNISQGPIHSISFIQLLTENLLTTRNSIDKNSDNSYNNNNNVAK